MAGIETAAYLTVNTVDSVLKNEVWMSLLDLISSSSPHVWEFTWIELSGVRAYEWGVRIGG